MVGRSVATGRAGAPPRAIALSVVLSSMSGLLGDHLRRPRAARGPGRGGLLVVSQAQLGAHGPGRI
ncbi:hypothetical protein roselon_02456 [Roseibacterium elongatum DSM 19469]|uniref:Uncharacterized protein n=1 Tax=Roseicyclus elongatus DSM 19469 TaxID=1294273 RepID=W8RU77_9RHOB|nr:hypothetical protein roselon_02456 [Roseibacterium elongatum DSM 19469]